MQHRRPGSAASRPRSAGGTTRTKTYFDSRGDGKSSVNEDEGDDVPSPFFQSTEEQTLPVLQPEDDAQDDANDDGDVFAMKSKREFNDMQVSFSSVFKYLLTGNVESPRSTSADILCRPSGKCDDTSSSDNSRGPIGFLSSLLGTKKDGIDSNQLDADDGLFMRSSISTQACKSNVLRMEERIRRELSLGTKPSYAAKESEQVCTTNTDTTETPEKEPYAKIDESFWMSPGRQLVGPEQRGGIARQEVELTIHIGEIKFTEHPDFTAAEVMELAKAEVSQPGWIPREEKMRQRRVTSERYFVRLLVNGNVVGDTKAVQLDWPSFSMNLGHRFNLQLSRIPTEMCLQIWKSSFGFVPDTLLCTCFVPSSDDSNVLPPTPVVGESLQFSSTGQRRWKGSVWLTGGVQTVKCSRSATSRMANVPPRQDPSRLIRPPVSDFETRCEKKILYPGVNDPCPALDRQSMMAFRSPAGILFTNNSLLEEPLRHILIRKRCSNPASVPSPIPITELEVQNSDIYRDLVSKDDEFGDGISDVVATSSIIKQHDRLVGERCRDVLREIKEFTRQKEGRTRKHSLASVVQDVGLFRFANNQETFELPLPTKLRSLFPNRSQQEPDALANDNTNLVITVAGGENLPRRVDNDVALTNGDNKLDTTNEQEDEGYFIKIKFSNGKSRQTKVIPHRSTQWKESIRIPLPKESSPNLQDEVIDISLFDSTTIDLQDMGGYYEDEDTKISEARYLGHVSVPLATVFRNGTMNGFVHCQCPDVVVGYENQDGGRRSNASSVLRMHITTTPLTMIPRQPRPEFPISESDALVARVDQWSQRHLNFEIDPENHCSVLWPDSSGNSYLVSRFLRVQSPPLGFDTIASCSHFVSLLPLVGDDVTWRDKNVTLTSQKCLDTRGGNREEHAILLANLLLYLSNKSSNDADVFLAVGFAIPEGETAWVVRRCRQTGEVSLYDATTGCSYTQNEDCPLQKIFYLASSDNVYSNVEREKRPRLLDFDVSNPRKWAPLHRRRQSKATVTVQDEALHFTAPDTHYATRLQDDISETVQNAIREWRRSTTSFRSDVASKLADAIEKLEQSKLRGQPAATNGNEEFQLPASITKARTAFGFALHFTSAQADVLDRIKSTEIHRNRHPQVEFAVAVRAFPCPGGLFSLWVFVCSLVPK